MATPLHRQNPASSIRAVLAALDAEHRRWRTEGGHSLDSLPDVRDWLATEAETAEMLERCY
jgi:hypothetical protein